MRTVLTPAQMGAVDRYMIEEMRIPGLILMENAAHGVYEAIREEVEPCTVQVFCGTGNNGGDGFAVARILMANGYDVQVILLGDVSKLSDDASANFAFFQQTEDHYQVIHTGAELEKLPLAEVYVDAIFGTGLKREVTGVYQAAVEYLNEQDALIVSVDIPSGVHAETGRIMGVAVKADITVTFQYPKIGHYLFPGREHAGELQIVKIGVDEGCDVPLQATVCAYESDDEDICFGQRAANTNKGSYGKLLLVAGSYGMAGAAVLSARAASRAGAGLVTLASCREVVDVLQQNVPEATCFPLAGKDGKIAQEAMPDIERLMAGKTALAMGPGLGTGEDIIALTGNVVTKGEITKVIDADAINALAGHQEFLDHKQGEIILTPHPKEFSRLSGMEMQEILDNPLKAATCFAVEYEVTLVLKGSTTVIADKFGNATLVCVGTPGMAKGGSGDVLAGLIAGFAAQGKDPYEAALCGVYVAGMAGEHAAELEGEYSMTPMDTVNYIGYAIENASVDYIVADTVKKQKDENALFDVPAKAKYAAEPEEKVQFFAEETTEKEPSNDVMPTAEVVEETQEVLNESAAEEIITDETKIMNREPEQEKIPDFLEKYVDVIPEEQEEPLSRMQQRKTKEKERRPLFPPRRIKEQIETQVDDDAVNRENIREEAMKEMPKPDGDKPTRRKIG